MALAQSSPVSVIEERMDFVRSIARQVCGERGAWRFEDDLVSEGGLQLVRIAGSNPGYLPFCRKRLKGAMLDWLEKYGRVHEDLTEERPAEVLLPDEQVQQHERTKRLRTAVIELPDVERQVIERIYRDGWTQARVADELGLNQYQVSRIRQRALRTMRPSVIQAAA